MSQPDRLCRAGPLLRIPKWRNICVHCPSPVEGPKIDVVYAALLILQAFPVAPLPAQAEPAVERYAACVFGALEADQSAMTSRARIERQTRKALDKCTDIRAASVRDAEHALREVPGFGNPERRRSFVHERFDGLDAIVGELAAGGMDPDKW